MVMCGYITASWARAVIGHIKASQHDIAAWDNTAAIDAEAVLENGDIGMRQVLAAAIQR